MGKNEELVVRIRTVTQMEVANQHTVPTHNLVQYKDQMATEKIEAHAMRVESASEMVLVKFQVWNCKTLPDMKIIF